MSTIELCPCPCCRRRCPILQKDFSNFVHLSEHQLRAFQPISTKGNQDSDHIPPPPPLFTLLSISIHTLYLISRRVFVKTESPSNGVAILLRYIRISFYIRIAHVILVALQQGQDLLVIRIVIIIIIVIIVIVVVHSTLSTMNRCQCSFGGPRRQCLFKLYGALFSWPEVASNT